MRIACLHVPQFALQCATRIDPALRNLPVAIVGAAAEGARARGAAHGPVVLACSRAAWTMGVRIGMTAPAARAEGDASELVVLAADAAVERDTVRAIADALLHIAPVVDVGGRVGPGGAHLAVYCEVPSRTRGATFGERALERLAELGLTGRVGIADDRFTAWVAATSVAHADTRKRVEDTRHAEAATLAAPRAVFEWAAPVEGAVREVTVDADPAPGGAKRRAPYNDPGAGRWSDPSVGSSTDPAKRRPAYNDPGTGRSSDPSSGSASDSAAVPHVLCVPRGGSAAYLAPRPLSLLSITPEVQRVLEALGVATLGEFASLPAPSIARPFEADFQALARGEGGHALRPYAPDAPIREEVVLGGPRAGEPSATGGLGVALALLARRIGLRLAGRGRSAARLDVAITMAKSDRTVRVDMLGRAPRLEAHADEYVEALAEAIGDAIGDGAAVWRVAVTVVGEALPVGDAAAPEVRAAAIGSAPTTHPAAVPALETRPVHDSATHARSAHAQTRLRLQEPPAPEVALREALDGADRELQRTPAAVVVASQELRLPDAAHQEEIDALSVVLASTGTVDLAQVLQMSMAQGLERGAWREYRRTRRGKQRRRVERAAAVQPKLFKNLP